MGLLQIICNKPTFILSSIEGQLDYASTFLLEIVLKKTSYYANPVQQKHGLKGRSYPVRDLRFAQKTVYMGNIFQ